MGMDDNLVNLLQDLIKFLECLCEINLPNDVENTRDNLLQRSKTNLEVQNQHSTSPYLNMSAGKGKGLILTNHDTTNDEGITEYIDAGNQQFQSSIPTSQEYYECFPEVKNSSETLTNEQSNSDDILVKIYNGFSTELTKSKCYKCGPLLQKEERKFIGFNFENLRSCWLGLVGTHLLVYSSKVEKQPSDIYSIRGYSSRAAPNATPRDPERGKSAFEVFSPGNKTLVFIARSPKDMEQWVAAICRSGCVQSDQSVSDKTIVESNHSLNTSFLSHEEQYQDVDNTDDNIIIIPEKQKNTKDLNTIQDIENNKTDKSYLSEKSNPEKLKNSLDNIPIVPARISRRLPSLPHENSLSYEHLDDGYDEDDIYHKIDDLKQSAISSYQNLNNSSILVSEKSPFLTREQETYDDIQNTIQEEIKTYDDMDSIELSKNKKLLLNKSIEISPKKKSIFSRIKKDFDSPKKQIDNKKKIEKNKKDKRKIKDNEKLIENLIIKKEIELPTYDDVSDVKIEFEHEKNDNNEQSDYICPPTPRPISINVKFNNQPEEVYDDIGELRVSERVESSLGKREDILINHDDEEHYKVPRVHESINPGQLTVTIEEELYDDIAILTEFRTRQRDSGCSSSSSDKTGNNVVKVWSRFSSGRRNKIADNLIEKSVNNKKTNGDESVNVESEEKKKEEDEEEEQGEEEESETFKLNKFQKLINKMEYSLSKSKPLSTVNKNNNN